MTVYLTKLLLTKTASTTYADNGYGAAGDVISYSYVVTNDTSGSLSNIMVNDNLIPSANINCPSSSLAGGANETCTGPYTVTQADVDRGYVTNTATVSATTPTSETVTSAPSSATVYASNATSSLSLVKSTTTHAYGVIGPDPRLRLPGDEHRYHDGEQRRGLRQPGLERLNCPDSTLAPGASETCTGSYTTTQADVDNGFVINTATATSDNPSDTPVTSNQSSATAYASEATSSLSLMKSSLTSAYGSAGEAINYDYLVDNTGTTTESDIAVSDNLVCDVDCPDATLAPGVSETCTGSYTATQADVDDGSVINTATASAGTIRRRGDTITSNSSSVTVTYSGILITTTSPLPTATIGTPYSDQFTVTGGNGGTAKWSAESGLPKGLKLRAAVAAVGHGEEQGGPRYLQLTIEVKETHRGSTVEDVKFLSLPVQY